MSIQGAHVRLESNAEQKEIEAVLCALIAAGPFRLTSVESIGRERHDCTFGLKRPGLAVGYRNIIDLQHSIAKSFDIVRVERAGDLVGC